MQNKLPGVKRQAEDACSFDVNESFENKAINTVGIMLAFAIATIVVNLYFHNYAKSAATVLLVVITAGLIFALSAFKSQRKHAFYACLFVVLATCLFGFCNYMTLGGQ